MGKQAQQPVPRVTENTDGSAMVEMPDDEPTGFEGGDFDNPDQGTTGNTPPEDDDDNQSGDGAGDGEGDDHDGGDDDDDEASHAAADARAASNGRTPAEQEAIREQRRRERADKKQRERDRLSNLQRQLAQQAKVIQELTGRQAQTERRAVGSDLAQIDTALNTTNANIERLNGLIAAAITKQDGKAVVAAQQRLFQEMRQQEVLTNAKTALVNGQRQAQQGPPAGAHPGEQGPSPQLIRMATAWGKRNPWYNPAVVSMDDRIVRTLDDSVSDDGYDPATREYWDELDRRIAKHLPHRVGKGGTMGAQRDGKPNNQRRVPVNGGSQNAGSQGSSNRGFTVSAERVRALKDAGLWDDPKARAQAIKEYQEYDRAHRNDVQR